LLSTLVLPASLSALVASAKPQTAAKSRTKEPNCACRYRKDLCILHKGKYVGYFSIIITYSFILIIIKLFIKEVYVRMIE
jgi:hypothetical protein